MADGRNVWLVGGGDLVGQFHDQGLLDEVLISFASVFLGAGAPLLPRRIVTPPLAASRGHRLRSGLRDLAVCRAQDSKAVRVQIS